MAAPDPRITAMDEQVALPRKNGELVFEAPWEARAFGLAVALNEAGVYPWRDFSQGLAAETAVLVVGFVNPLQVVTTYAHVENMV